MIINARKILESQDNTGFELSCDKVMRDIMKASRDGLHETCFCPDVYMNGRWVGNYYHAVKGAFKRRGYTFHPTGYVGGVRQLTEQICW